MENKSHLPIKIKNNKLADKIKSAGINSLKFAGLSLAALGSAAAFVGALAFAPILLPPTILLAAYTGQKILNHTQFKSYKDLDFIIKKHKGNYKIFQDFFRPSMLKEFSKLNFKQKVGLMQLQAIVGISKFQSDKLNANTPTFETDTHSFLQKTFKNLEESGYINNYSETFLKKSNLIASKIALGNFKDLGKSTDFYNVKFNISDKPIDLNDENLHKTFPLVFSTKYGILNKYGIVQNPDGSYQIDYKNKYPFNHTNTDNIKNTFKEKYNSNISLESQRDFSENFEFKQNQNSRNAQVNEKEDL